MTNETPPPSQHREPIEADREGSDKTDNDTVSYSASVASTSQGADGRHAPKPCPFCGAHLGDEEMVGSEPVRFHPGVVTDATCLLAGKGFFRVDMEAWDRRASLPAAASVEAGERVRILSEVRAALRKFEGACVHTEIMSQDYRTGFKAGFNAADLAILDMINAATPSTEGRKGKDQA